MRPLTCAAARRRLNAFHDGELAIGEQIAVASHLEWCDHCAAASAEMRAVGVALRAAAPGRAALSHEEAAAFTAALVSRLRAEREVSLLRLTSLMFTDMRLIYAGLGGAVAVLICAGVMLTMMRFAVDERPDTLPLMAAFLATPGMTELPMPIDEEMRSRWAARVRQANETAAQDAVFELSGFVTLEGRVPMLQHLRRGRHAVADQAMRIEGLLDALSRARLEPTPGLPSTMVWLITSTTVRAPKPPPLDLQLPAAKKRAASRSIPWPLFRA